MKKETLFTSKPTERPSNWDEELNKYPLYDKSPLPNAYVAWHCSEKYNKFMNFVFVVGDIGDKYFYHSWTYTPGKKGENFPTTQHTIIFNTKEEFKDWLKKERGNDIFKNSNLFNIVRFLYF